MSGNRTKTKFKIQRGEEVVARYSMENQKTSNDELQHQAKAEEVPLEGSSNHSYNYSNGTHYIQKQCVIVLLLAFVLLLTDPWHSSGFDNFRGETRQQSRTKTLNQTNETTSMSSSFPEATQKQPLNNQHSNHPHHHQIPLISPACNATLPNDTRLLLLTNVQAEHGSTSILSLFMSSPNVTTLCKNKAWQCEANRFVKYQGKLSDTNLHRYNVLEENGRFWDLQKSIFLDKMFPGAVEYRTLVDVACAAKVLPPRLQAVGIRRLVPVEIFMWTPLCVMTLQHKNFRLLSHHKKRFLEKEVALLQVMRQHHESLVKQGVPTLILSYADLLFNEATTLARLNQFLPCGHGIHTNFVAQLHVDIVKQNQWKVQGSIHDYARTKDAHKCCGYDPATSTCVNRTLYHLNPDYRERLEELEAYFRDYSLLGVVTRGPP